MQLNMFYGICLAPRGHSEVAIALESLYPTACLFFILGVQLSRHIKVSNNNLDGVLFEDKDPSKNQMKVIWIIVGVAIVLCTYFFIAGGINVFLRSLGDFFSNTTQNYSSERAQFFSVKGTGYIYQFRVILLPILTPTSAILQNGSASLWMTIRSWAVRSLF